MDKWKEEHEKGKFWIVNRFIRKYSRDLSIYAQMVYVAMCCYTGKKQAKNYETFVGCRLIGEVLNINKNTVAKAKQELEAYGLIRRLSNRNGRATHYRIYTDPYDTTKPYAPVIHKGLKENKEEANLMNFKELNEPDVKRNKKAINKVKEDLKKKGIYKK